MGMPGKAERLDSRPTAETYTLERLFRMVREGYVRVPHFQRDFRWGREDVLRLFDSIVRGYPIGSLLLWLRPAPAKKLTLGALQIDAPERESALWVVDGQQRIISLVNALDPNGQHDERFALSYDILADEFVASSNAQSSTAIPLPILFDLPQVLKWFNSYPDASDYVDRVNSVTSTLRQFPVPASQVDQEDPQVLRDIFDRLNNYGKRLKRAEIFAALNEAGAQDDSGSLTFELISDRIQAEREFGRIDADTVLKAVLSRRGPDVQREIRDEFGKQDPEGRDAAFQEAERALLRAVAFLQEDVNVPHISFLAYRYLLVVLARFFALYPEPDSRNRQLLRRWYWRAAVIGPGHFKGDTTGAMRKLCKLVRANDISGTVQSLLRAVSDVDPPALPGFGRFSAREVSTKIVLCSWWSAGPRKPTGDLYDRGQLARCLDERQTAREAVQNIATPSGLTREYRSHGANRVLMPTDDGDSAQDLLGTGVGVEAEWAEVLRSHALTPHIMSALDAGDVDEFIIAREALLKERLDKFLRRMCEWGFEDTPPLAELVSEVESEEFLKEDEGTDSGTIIGG